MTETERILALWNQEKEIRPVSRLTGISAPRIRRILIDNGVCPTARAREIQSLAGAGMTPEEIAARLKVTVRTVYNYLPYRRGTYTKDSHTTVWRRSKETE